MHLSQAVGRRGGVRRPQAMRVCILSLVAGFAPPSWAQDAPALQALRARPVRIVVASGPGGGVDLTARHLAKTMSEILRHNLLVENRPGAGSATGTEYAARATPDGHTLLVSSGSSMVMNGFLYRHLPYDALRDFVAVGFIVAYPFVLIARNDLPANDLAALMKHARAHPGKLTYASAGVGSLQHVWGTILFKSMGLELLHVPYKGAAVAVQEMMGGRIELMFDNLSAARVHIEAGRVKALAVSPAKRVAQLPHVPTVNESGVTRFDGESWMGLFAPAATPRATVALLRATFEQALLDADLRARLEAGGGRLMAVPAREQQAFLRSEMQRWGEAIKRYGVTAQ